MKKETLFPIYEKNLELFKEIEADFIQFKEKEEEAISNSSNINSIIDSKKRIDNKIDSIRETLKNTQLSYRFLVETDKELYNYGTGYFLKFNIKILNITFYIRQKIESEVSDSNVKQKHDSFFLLANNLYFRDGRTFPCEEFEVINGKYIKFYSRGKGYTMMRISDLSFVKPEGCMEWCRCIKYIENLKCFLYDESIIFNEEDSEITFKINNDNKIQYSNEEKRFYIMLGNKNICFDKYGNLIKEKKDGKPKEVEVESKTADCNAESKDMVTKEEKEEASEESSIKIGDEVVSKKNKDSFGVVSKIDNGKVYFKNPNGKNMLALKIENVELKQK